MQKPQQERPSQFKQKLFDFTKELVSNDMSLNLYLFFVIIENFQFLGYHANGLIFYNTLGFAEFGYISQYVNLLPFMSRININNIFVPIFFILTIVHISITVLGYKAYNKKIQQNTKLVKNKNLHKNRIEYFINFIIIAYNTFLTVPIFQTSLTAIYCLPDTPFMLYETCYSGVSLFIMALGTINMAWLLILNLYYTIYYYSRNPFLANFLTCSSNIWNFGKLSIKIVPMIYLVYDPYLNYPILFLITMTGTYAGHIALFRILFPYYQYNLDIQKKIFMIEGFTGLLSLCFPIIYVFQNLNTPPNFIFIGWAIMSALLTKIGWGVYMYFKKQIILHIHEVEKNKLNSIFEYLVYLIYQTQKSFNQNKGQFLILNLAKTHKEVCKETHCYCHQFFGHANVSNYHKNKKLFYWVLMGIIDRILVQNKKAYPFYILKAYILYYKLQSQIKAATTISIILSDKLDFSDQILAKGLLFELDQQYSDTRDLETYRKFNEYLLKQQEESLKLVDFHLKYWLELIDQNSSLTKLKFLLKSIKRSKKCLSQIVDGALDIFPNHVRVLFLYKNLLKQVLNDYVGFMKCEQKLRVGIRQSKLTNVDAQNQIQFRPNESLLVINFTRHYSAHSQIMGNFKIVTISSNVTEFLGFTQKQLTNQSINKIIPRIYHSVHDKFIENILDKKDSQIQLKQIRIFPINSEGFIVECNIISKYMPSISHGINIVSFFEQCDNQKNTYLMIYDGKSGLVDCMNSEANAMLKDGTKAKVNDIFSTLDHINDLIPNWDFINETWKNSIHTTSDFKSLASLKKMPEDKNIQILRSDGLENDKFIKILKFRGQYFGKMFSIQNQSEAEGNTITKYLSYRKHDQTELLSMIEKEPLLPDRNKTRKMTLQLLKQVEEQKNRIFQMEDKPSNFSRYLFLVGQICMLLAALGLAIYELAQCNGNIKLYNEDSSLLMSINSMQTYLSDTTYIISLVATQQAYGDPNMKLPYKQYVSSITMQGQLEELQNKLFIMNDLAKQVNPILISKVQENQIDGNSLKVNVKYLLTQNTKEYYTRNIQILQAVYQYIQYATDFIYKRAVLKESMTSIISSSNFFFIFANNIDVIPQNMINLKSAILTSVLSRLNNGYTVFLIIQLLIALLIVASAITILLYFNIIYNNYVLKVVRMYSVITIEQIKAYYDRCKKYKKSFIQKQDSEERSHPSKNMTGQCSDALVSMAYNQIDNSLRNQEDDQKMLVEVEQKEEINYSQHLLNFQTMPSLTGKACSLAFWTGFYVFILFGLCYNFNSSTNSLTSTITTLDKYTIMQNSAIQLRLFTQLSINMLGYWDQSYCDLINQQQQSYFTLTLQYTDETDLNFTKIKPIFAGKYQEFRLIQQYVLTKQYAAIDNITSSIQAQLEDMDVILEFFLAQNAYYLQILDSDAVSLASIMNICISISIIFIIIYWMLAVTYYFISLLQEHEVTYEMYNIIGYNLRKEIQNKF